MKKRVKNQYPSNRGKGSSESFFIKSHPASGVGGMLMKESNQNTPLNLSMICLDAAYAGFISSVAQHIQDAKKTDPQVKAAWDRLEISRNQLGCVYDLQAVAEFSAGLAVA